MQHRRKKHLIPLALVLILAGGFGFLALHDVPAQRQPVEQTLDAQALLKE